MRPYLQMLTTLLLFVAMLAGCGGSYDNTLVTASGWTLDNSFGAAGKVTTSIGTITATPGSSYDKAFCIAIQPDGKVVTAGSVDNQRGFALTRYNTDGSLDASFGTGGKVTTVIAVWDEVRSVAIQADGRIIAAGYSSTGSFSYYRFALARYNSDGSLDGTFGTAGIVTTPIGSVNAVANSAAIQADGRIVLAGSADNGFALARYTTNGTLDNTFGTGGIVLDNLGTGFDIANSLAIQSNGKIIAAGNVNDNTRTALVRYNTDGTHDSAFGLGGIIVTDIGTSTNEARSVAVQSDGKIVMAGFAGNGANYYFALARYAANGALDPAFGIGGINTTFFGAGNAQAYGAVIQPNGRIVLAGFVYTGTNNDFALARYTADGFLDPTFGTFGRMTNAIGTRDDFAYGVAVQPDGKIIAAGYMDNGINFDFALARYKP